MANPKSKNECPLAKTTISHLLNWYNLNYRKRSKNIQTKYTTKGIDGEDTSITLVNMRYPDLPILKKNTQRKTNEYLSGECDLFVNNFIRDIKTSWNVHTFPNALFPKRLDNSYWCQLQGYMSLWECSDAFVDFCLIDTPPRLVCDELRRLDWKYGLFDTALKPRDEHIPMVIETISNLIYTRKGLELFISDPFNGFDLEISWFKDFVEIPISERVTTYHVQRDDEFIERIEARVRLIREYLQSKGIDQGIKVAA